MAAELVLVCWSVWSRGGEVSRNGMVGVRVGVGGGATILNMRDRVGVSFTRRKNVVTLLWVFTVLRLILNALKKIEPFLPNFRVKISQCTQLPFTMDSIFFFLI